MARALFLLLLGLAAVLPGGGARAHAVLLETTPANGAALDGAPREITLRFNEPVTPIALALIGRDGRMALVPAAADTTVRATVAQPLPEGSYIVSYRVVSADSHPVGGAVLFIVGTPSESPSVPDSANGEAAAQRLVILNRIVLLAGLLFAAGGMLFLFAVSGPAHPLSTALRRPLRIGAAIGIAAALAAIPLQGLLLTGALGQSIAWREVLRVGWQSSLGTSAAVVAAGLLAVLAGWRRGGAPHWLALAGALLAPMALALSGHAATAPPRWLATPAMALHGLALCFWAGSLWPLRRALDEPIGAVVPLVLRFSWLAAIAVTALLLSGVTLAALQLDGDVAALVTTSYGRLLLVKLLLVALLLALATWNKFRLTPRLCEGGAAVTLMQRSIGLEILAMLLIVALTTVLGQTPPPRTAPAASGHAGHGGASAAAPPVITAESRGYRALMSVTPGRVGRNTITLFLRQPDGTPLEPLEAQIEFRLPQAGIEPLTQPLLKSGAGRYRVTTAALLRPGSWQLEVRVLIDDFERVSFEMVLPVAEH